MRTLSFPYVRVGALYLPIVPLTIFGRNLSFKTAAYVDSGAYYSIFRSEVLDSLQLDKTAGRLKMLKAADGRLIRSYLYRLPLQLGGEKLRGQVAFSDQLNVGFNLLGRHSIFDAFDEVVFNERQRTTQFRQFA